ncbi:MAG TPA: 4-hydroxybenzoate 3-monooxygenase [Casimicrobiaceae bacterium]|nr:4-hydroxybenzoate 3-monooxygenase [Casimicrobiaceae bacterium]
MQCDVGIIGAGPAGLLLSHLLAREGIASIIVEARSRRYCEERVRAGVLEQQTVDLMNETGVGERMRREGLTHDGIRLRFGGQTCRIDLATLTQGKRVTVYGQHEVVKDLIRARFENGGRILFEATNATLRDIDGSHPSIRCTHDGREIDIACEFVAGCDGFHGISRSSIPADALRVYERAYPFAWLGILAEAAPVSEELIYALHDDGFALLSMRSRKLTRLYLQCTPDEDVDEWSDARIWEALHRRLADAEERINEGPILQKGVTPMRSFVVEPMQWNRLFLAGDAAHIVPPTGAKGMNLAVADVRILARAFGDYFRRQREDSLASYSAACLHRIWKAQRFSWWMTSMLHRFDGDGAFDRRRQLAELEYIAGSRAAQTALAENYVGLPL